MWEMARKRRLVTVNGQSQGGNMDRQRRILSGLALMLGLLPALLGNGGTCADYVYPNNGQTYTYTQRVTIVNNCADAAYAIMTTPSDALSEALWANATVPGNTIWWAESPGRMTGATSALPRRRASASASA